MAYRNPGDTKPEYDTLEGEIMRWRSEHPQEWDDAYPPNGRPQLVRTGYIDDKEKQFSRSTLLLVVDKS